MHQYVRRKKVSAPTVGPLKLVDGSVTTDCHLMAEIFADSFASVFKNEPLSPAPHQRSDSQIEHIAIHYNDISCKLSLLDSNSSMGPDGIHPQLLKSCPAVLSPLYLIFTKSLSTGLLPRKWKESSITPIFKKGSRHQPLNYRPISLTSVCCKTLERIVVAGLTEYLDNNDLLSIDQFGFRSGRSTEDQLLLTYNSITSWVDRGFTADLILFDFSKAFDVVNHTILLQKLSCLGISGTLLQWIQNFLVQRTMSVSVSGITSSHRPITSGVPQGSVLGPLLFIIYVNHLPSYIKCECKIFADDLKIYLPIRSLSAYLTVEDISNCQRDINTICNISNSWGLSLNIEKCVTIRFFRGTFPEPDIGSYNSYSLNGTDIQRVNDHKDLGVLVDTSLRFHMHTKSIANKAAGLAANLLKATICRTQNFMLTLFITHVRPLLEYCSCLWNTGYLSDLKMLETVQRSWTRHIDGMTGLSYKERLIALDLYSVRGRLIRADIIKYWKIFHSDCSISPEDLFSTALHSHTRGHRFKIAHQYSSVDLRSRFFSFRCVRLWNSLPDHVVALDSLPAFKSALHNCLGDILYDFVE